MSRYIGTAVNTQPTQSSAAGVYTLKDQLVYNTREQWPVGRDPYFNQTTLLLQGDVPYTRGRGAMTLPLAYNSDASTNNFLVTPNGDVGPKPFSPYFGGNYSVYFPGSSSTWIGTPDNAALELGANDFTIECWVYNDVNFSAQRIISSKWNQFVFGINTTPALILAWYGTSTSSSTGTLLDTSVNKWHHFAVCRSGSTLYAFQNGQRLTLTNSTITGTLNNDATGPIIGGNANQSGGVITAANDPWTGYISNYRLVNGTALYTAPFTPSTQPLQNIPNTSLLTCQSNRFIDNSSNNFTITRNGDSRITDNSPFVSTDFTTGAGYFDGNGDYLSAGNQAALHLGSGNFTVEMWLWKNANTAYMVPCGDYVNPGENTFQIIGDATGTKIAWYNGSSSSFVLTSSSTILINTWNHIAFVRNSGTLSLYLNGSSDATPVALGTDYNATTSFVIGNTAELSAGRWWSGYISNLRIVKGAAVYTGNFSPPSLANLGRSGATSIAAYPSTTNVNTSFAESATSLLTLQTRAPSQNIGFIDSSPNEFVVTKNGNASQGTFSPFSPTGWSLSCDATNTYDLPGSILAFGSGNWTVEAWASIPSGGGGPILYPFNSGNTACILGFSIGIGPTSIDYYAVSGATPIVYSTTINVNQWYHIALVKDGSSARLYLNGVQVATGTDTTTYTTPTGGVRIAAIYNLTNTYAVIVNNLRIVTGQALYQANTNFTPSSQNLNSSFIGHKGLEATPITGTVRILTAIDNRPIDRSSNNHTIARSNTPKIVPLSPFAPTSAISLQLTGGSGYFSGGSLTTPHSPALNLNSVDFCIEGWVYLIGGAVTIAQKYVGGVVASSEYYFAIDGTNQLSIAVDGGGGEDYFRTSANTVTPNAWNHCVVTRVGNAFRLFINGVLQNYSTSSRTLNATSTGFTTAGGSGNYISSIRITKGTIPDQYQTVATTTGIQVFTPPTGPLTNIPGTQLLLNFTNAAAVDATGRNNLESVGNVHTTRAQAKFDPLIGGSSLYFDGTGDYLKIPYSQQLYFGSSNWTLEFWFYPLSFTDNNVIFDFGYGSPDTLRSIIFYTAQTSGLLRIAQSPNGSTNYDVSTGITVSLNQWQHIACVRNGSTITSYLNGVAFSPITAYDTYNSTTKSFFVGIQGDLQEVTTMHGYIQNLRVTKAARYTTGTGGNANQMVFAGTNTLALPTGPFPRG